MATKKKSEARTRLEKITGPLTFGSNLRAARELQGMTQGDMAAKLGVSVQHVSNVERGSKGVSVERAAEWAAKLGWPEKVFVQLSLEDDVRRAGLDYSVTLNRAS